VTAPQVARLSRSRPGPRDGARHGHRESVTVGAVWAPAGPISESSCLTALTALRLLGARAWCHRDGHCHSSCLRLAGTQTLVELELPSLQRTSAAARIVITSGLNYHLPQTFIRNEKR
jgi:hypothetical protein